MPITVVCACGKRLRTPEENAGRSTKCPNCGEEVTFPAAAPAPDLDLGPDDPTPPEGYEVVPDAPWAPSPDLDRDLAGVVDPEPEPEPSPPAAPVPRAESPAEPPPAEPEAPRSGKASFRLADEPWYYGALDLVFSVFLLIAAIQLVVVVLLVILAIAGAATLGGAEVTPVAFVLLYSMGILAATLLVTCPLLLLVDVARNVRHARRQIDRGVEALERIEARVAPAPAES